MPRGIIVILDPLSTVYQVIKNGVSNFCINLVRVGGKKVLNSGKNLIVKWVFISFSFILTEHITPRYEDVTHNAQSFQFTFFL